MTAVADLSPAEAAELGSLLQQASWVASQLVEAEQVYNCLWSHAGGVPGHIHYVIQPVTKQQIDCPRQFRAALADAAAIADEARRLFALEQVRSASP